VHQVTSAYFPLAAPPTAGVGNLALVPSRLPQPVDVPQETPVLGVDSASLGIVSVEVDGPCPGQVMMSGVCFRTW
jgi:hypothetical protein